MAEKKECPTCGTPLAPHATYVYCPRCLLTAGLEDALDSGETPPPSLGGEDLLFCTVAVLLRHLDLGSFAGKVPESVFLGPDSLANWLAIHEALTPGEVDALRNVVSGILELHGGDPESALDSLDPDGAIQTALFDPASAAPFGVRAGSPMAILGGQTNAIGISGVRETPGRYSQLGEHGRGGMGRVLLVHDAVLGRDVALKELAPGMELDADSPSTPVRRSMGFLSRFLQEARITGQLEHPSIVPVYELGYRPDRTLYYTMKLVRGKTLRKAIEACQTLQNRLGLLPHFVDLCQAVAYAHSRGIIHRDIKPENVMVGEFGETVVLDWGLARSRRQEDVHSHGMAEALRVLRTEGAAAAGKTEYGHIMGTPAYMAPEQAEGNMAEVDEGSDVYSLGVVLYEILTGKVPFDGESSREILKKVIVGDAVPIKTHEPNAPLELVAIAAKAMRKDKERRYPDAKSLANEIQQFLTGGLISAYEYRFSEHLFRFVKKHRASVAAGLAAALVLITVIGVAVVRINNAKRVAEQHLYESTVAYTYEAIKNRQFDDARRSLLTAPEKHRNWEWGLLAAHLHPQSITLADDLPSIDCATFSSGGRLVAAGSLGEIRVWNAESGALLYRLSFASSVITCLRFSADGKLLLASDSSGWLGLWDVQTGRERLRIHAHPKQTWPTGKIHEIAIDSLSETIATASEDGTCALWDVGSGEKKLTLTGHTGDVFSVAFSPDTLRVATGGYDGELRLWDVASGTLLHQIRAHDKGVRLVRYSPDGYEIATSGNDTDTRGVRIWNAATGALIRRFPELDNGIFTPDGAHIANRLDPRSIWSNSDGQRVRLYDGIPNVGIYDVDFTSQRLLGDIGKGEVSIIGMVPQRNEVELRGHSGNLMAVTFSPDSRLVATGAGDWARWEDYRAIVWDVVTGHVVRILDWHSGPVNSLVFTSDGNQVLTGSSDGMVGLWHVATGHRVWTFQANHQVRQIALAPDSRSLVSVGWGMSTAQVWDVQTGNRLASLSEADGAGDSVAYDPLSRYIAAGTRDGRVIVWDANTFERLKTLETGNKSWVTSVNFSPDGEWLALDFGVVQIWTTENWKLVARLSGTNGQVHFHPDGKRLIAGSTIWDTDSWRRILSLPWGGVNNAFSPDGNTLALQSGNNLVLWRAFPWKADDYPGDSSMTILDRLDTQRRAQAASDLAREADLSKELACLEILSDLDMAAIEWAGTEDESVISAPPPLMELRRQLSSTDNLVTCPEGGDYTFSGFGVYPKCSIHGHPPVSLKHLLQQYEEAVKAERLNVIALFADRIIAELPTDAGHLNSLSWSWLVGSSNTQPFRREYSPVREQRLVAASLLLARNAVALAPDNEFIVDTLAFAEFCSGDLGSAVARFKEALQKGCQPSTGGLALALLTRGTNSDIAEACRLLDVIFAERQRNPETPIYAALYVDKALAALRGITPPDDPALRDQIASVLELAAAPPPPVPSSTATLYPLVFAARTKESGGNVTFVFGEDRPFPQCHASTIAELPDGNLVAAWYGGTQEKHSDVGIWSSIHDGKTWSAPVEIAKISETPHWNPVLFRDNAGELHLFFKVGPEISTWQTYWMHTNDGRVWSESAELVSGDQGGRGPARNRPIVLTDGTWLAPGSTELGYWKAFADRSVDQGKTWTRTEDFSFDPGNPETGLIQPAFWESEPGKVHAMLRSAVGAIFRSDSEDSGKTWSPAYDTGITGNGGLDVVRLQDGRLLLARNPLPGNARNRLELSVSSDNGKAWQSVAYLEDDADSSKEYSYPSMIQKTSGDVVITYTYLRERVRCWVIPLAVIEAAEAGAPVPPKVEDGFTTLFNGVDLTGWSGDTQGYQARGGELVCTPGGDLYAEGEYSNFNVRFEFKLTPGANNGLGIRAVPGLDAAYDAIELQILDDSAPKHSNLQPWQYHGSVYGVVPARRGFLKPTGEWNSQEVIADGDHIKVILNGETILDTDLKEAVKGGIPDGREHPGLFNKSGRIGFLGYGDVVHIRNIRIRPL